jgi:bacteriorhodopsin
MSLLVFPAVRDGAWSGTGGHSPAAAMVEELAWASVTWEHPVPERLRTNSFLFSVICLYSTLNVIFSPLNKKREVSATATAIHGCGCISYFLMGNNWWPIVTAYNGRPLLTARVVEWTISVPLFVYMLAQLIDPLTYNVRRAQAKQSLAIILGGVGPMISSPYSWVFFVLSM